MFPSIPADQKAQAEALAGKVGTHIPGDIHPALWYLPVIEKLLERVEKLEEKLEMVREACPTCGSQGFNRVGDKCNFCLGKAHEELGVGELI